MKCISVSIIRFSIISTVWALAIACGGCSAPAPDSASAVTVDLDSTTTENKNKTDIFLNGHFKEYLSLKEDIKAVKALMSDYNESKFEENRLFLKRANTQEIKEKSILLSKHIKDISQGGSGYDLKYLYSELYSEFISMNTSIIPYDELQGDDGFLQYYGRPFSGITFWTVLRNNVTINCRRSYYRGLPHGYQNVMNGDNIIQKIFYCNGTIIANLDYSPNGRIRSILTLVTPDSGPDLIKDLEIDIGSSFGDLNSNWMEISLLLKNDEYIFFLIKDDFDIFYNISTKKGKVRNNKRISQNIHNSGYDEYFSIDNWEISNWVTREISNGDKHTIKYTNDKNDGYYRMIDSNNIVKYELNLLSGMVSGNAVIYDNRGEIEMRAMFDSGKIGEIFIIK